MPIIESYTNNTNSDELYQLIHQCIRNERRAQESLYKMFFNKMLAVAMRYSTDRAEAEDIMNMGFLKCFQKIETFSFQGSFEGWLRKIMVRTALDHLKAHHNYTENTLFIEKEETIDKDLGDKMYYDQLISLVQSLPHTTKTVFNLSVMEAMSHKEINLLVGKEATYTQSIESFLQSLEGSH